MVILSKNPYTVSYIMDLKVEQLILNGKPYESCKENLITFILRGTILQE